MRNCKSVDLGKLKIVLSSYRYFIDDSVPVKDEEFAFRIVAEVDRLKRTFRDLGGNAGLFRFANWVYLMRPIELLYVHNLFFGIS